MSPTVFRERGYRFFFFSREESRMHVHVEAGSGEAKFWLEPMIELAQSFGLSKKELALAREMTRSHEDDIRRAWRQHFGG